MPALAIILSSMLECCSSSLFNELGCLIPPGKSISSSEFRLHHLSQLLFESNVLFLSIHINIWLHSHLPFIITITLFKYLSEYILFQHEATTLSSTMVLELWRRYPEFLIAFSGVVSEPTMRLMTMSWTSKSMSIETSLWRLYLAHSWTKERDRLSKQSKRKVKPPFCMFYLCRCRFLRSWHFVN